MADESRIDKAAKVMMMTGFFMALALLLAIIGTALTLMALGKPVPKELADWSNTALGFLFGSLMGLVKDWMNGK